jgi:hypothetical protein
VRFGLFEWLRFDDKDGVIVDSTGAIVARKGKHGEWFVDHPQYSEMGFSDPMITSSPMHPHRMSGRPRMQHPTEP